MTAHHGALRGMSSSGKIINYWLIKQEPKQYSWADLVRDGGTCWSGVRNFQARTNLRWMKKGDPVLFYHSGKEKAVVGMAIVSKGGYPDPTASKDELWVAIDIKPVRSFAKPVSLAIIRAHPELQSVALIRQSRLSVMPLSKQEFEIIARLGE